MKVVLPRGNEARRGIGNDCQQALVEVQWGCMLCMSNQMSTCVTGFPLFSLRGWLMSGFRKSQRNGGSERNSVCSSLWKEKERKVKNIGAFKLLLTFRLESQLRKSSYRHTEQPPWWQGEGKWEENKIQKQCPPSRGDWKAAKSNYDCENLQTPRLSSQQTS